MLQDLKFAWRRLRQSPGPALFAIFTLVVGIGTSTATFSVVQTALWRPMGIADPDHVVLISRTNMSEPGPATVSLDDFQRIDAARARVGATATAAWSVQPFAATVIGHGRGVLATGEFVTTNYFTMLRVPAAQGRVLAADDDRASAPNVAVLSDAAWRTQFASAPDVVGQIITVASEPFTIVGVAPRGFRGVHQQSLTYPSVWVPLHAAPTILPRIGWPTASPSLVVGLRLDGAHRARDAAFAIGSLGVELDRSAPLPRRHFPDGTSPPQLRRWTTSSITDDARYDIDSEMGRLVVLLPSLVLLVACTNIANLVLSRNASRRQDFGVRRALGATRWQLVREQVIEQGLVAAVGGLGAVAVAMWIIRATAGLFHTQLAPFMNGAPIDWQLTGSVIPAAAAGVILSVLVAGLIPALHLTRDSLRTVLAQGDAVSTPRWRGRGNLISLQLGVSVGLFLIALVFVRILISRPGAPPATVRVPPDAKRLAVATVPFSTQGRDVAFITRYVARVQADLDRSPGVTAGVTTNPALLPGVQSAFLPATTSVLDATIAHDGLTPAASERSVGLAAVSGSYFAATDTDVVQGRALDAADDAAIVINEGLALDLFGSTSGVGRILPLRITSRPATQPGVVESLTIVGISRGATLLRPGIHEADVFVPLRTHPSAQITFVARAAGGAPAPVDALVTALLTTDAEVAVAYVTTGDVLVSGPFAFAGTIAAGLVGLAALALILATVGLYGVLSHVIARRTREIGIRVALGATPRAITAMVLRDGFRPIAEGLFIGLGTATAIRFFMVRTMIQERVVPIDPMECTVCAALLFVAGALACWRPARQATRVTPMTALRTP